MPTFLHCACPVRPQDLWCVCLQLLMAMAASVLLSFPVYGIVGLAVRSCLPGKLS